MLEGETQSSVLTISSAGSTLKFSSVRPLAVGGLTLTGYMAKLLQERGYSYTNVNDLQLIKGAALLAPSPLQLSVE